MTKKHFEALADALAKIRPPVWRTDSPWNASVRAVADVCAEINPRFDRDKFVRACNER